MFLTLLWWYRYFLSKVNIWNVNHARSTAFIFDTRTGVLVKVSKFVRQKKYLDLRFTRTPNLRFHAECSNLLSYKGQIIAVPCFVHWLWWYNYFWSKVNILNVNCARATALICDTRTINIYVDLSGAIEMSINLHLHFHYNNASA